MKDAMIGIGSRWWRFPGAQIETDSWEGECRSDGKVVLRDDTGGVIEGVEVDAPEDAFALTTLSPENRRLREVNLARLMLVIADTVLASDPLGLETARDLLQEVRHTFPEWATIFSLSAFGDWHSSRPTLPVIRRK